MDHGIIGGDRRQAELARLLCAEGHTVHTYGLDAWQAPGNGTLETAVAAEVVLLPLPLSRDGTHLTCEAAELALPELFARFRPEQLLLAGQVRPEHAELASAVGLRLIDYFRREELTVANAAATAEAALQAAMERLDRTLLGMDCLVLGFGRIGKLLCRRLAGLGARVSAAARKPGDLAWVRALGYTPLETPRLDGQLGKFRVVFNTVPAPVLGETLLRQLPPDCLCVDLASVPGIDLEAAERLGLSNVWARMLPGRLTPVSAAEILRDTIEQIIREVGESGD